MGTTAAATAAAARRVLPLRAAGPLQPRVPAEREAPRGLGLPARLRHRLREQESCFKCFTPRVTTDDDRGRDGYAPVPRRDNPPRDEPRRRPRTKTSRDSDRTTQRAGDDRDEPANDARRNDEVRYGDFLECRTCYHPPFPPSTPPPSRRESARDAFSDTNGGVCPTPLRLLLFRRVLLRFPSGHSTLLRRARGRRVRGRIRLS